MIEKKEKIIIYLALREKVSKLENKELEKSFTEEFGVHAKPDVIIGCLINNKNEMNYDIYLLINNNLY